MPEAGTAGRQLPVRGGRRLPLWVWLVAAGGGLLVGYFILRRFPSGGQGGQASQPDQASQPSQGDSGAGAAPPILPPDLLEALGLKPPAIYGGGQVDTSGGGGGGGGDTSAGTSGSTISPNSSGYYDLRSLLGPTSQQTAYQGGALATQSSVQTAYQGGALKGTIFSGGSTTTSLQGTGTAGTLKAV